MLSFTSNSKLALQVWRFYDCIIKLKFVFFPAIGTIVLTLCFGCVFCKYLKCHWTWIENFTIILLKSNCVMFVIMRLGNALLSSSKYSSLIGVQGFFLNVWKVFGFYFSIELSVDLFVKVSNSTLYVLPKCK